MTKIFNILAASVLVACGCLFASQADARVCFATDPDCGSGGNFGEIDPEYMADRCLENGYTSIATDCQNTVGMQIGAYCPYDHKYAICCGLEYAYTKCTPPLKAAGVCGGKLKCECDTSKFAYMQKTASVCRNVLNGTEYENSRGDGGSCSYMGYDHTSQTSTINIRFAECTCDRGLYPKTEEECAKDFSDIYGAVCTDSNGNNFYADCMCNDEVYKHLETSCPYGSYVNEPICKQGAVYKVKQCCDCNSATYPYIDNGSIDTNVAAYTSCEHERGCTRGNRYRATKCKKGYKVVSGKCVPVSCEEAGKIFVASNSNYALLQSGKLYSYKETLNDDGSAEYTVSGINESSSKKVLVATSQAVSSLGNVEYYSPQYVANGSSHGAYKFLTQSCTEEAPTITYRQSNLAGKDLYAYGINFYLPQNTSVVRSLYITNGNFTATGTLTLNKYAEFRAYSYYPNGNNSKFSGDKLIVSSYINTSNYSISFNNTKFKSHSSNKNYCYMGNDKTFRIANDLELIGTLHIVGGGQNEHYAKHTYLGYEWNNNVNPTDTYVPTYGVTSLWLHNAIWSIKDGRDLYMASMALIGNGSEQGSVIRFNGQTFRQCVKWTKPSQRFCYNYDRCATGYNGDYELKVCKIDSNLGFTSLCGQYGSSGSGTGSKRCCGGCINNKEYDECSNLRYVVCY